MQALAPFKQAKGYWGVLLLNAVLFLVWPLAHTIALRKLLLVIAAIAGITLWVRNPQRRAILRQPWLALMGLLLAWVMFHAAFISQNGNDAWREVLGQWLPPCIAIFAGIGAALASRHVDAKQFNRLLLFCALALPVYYLLANLVKWAEVGYLPIGYMKPGEPNFVLAGTDLKTSLTFSLEMLAPFACVKLLEIWKLKGRMVIRTYWLLPLVLAVLLAIVSQIKNFMIMLAVSIMLTLLIQVFRSRILNAGRLLAGIAGLAMLAAVLVNTVHGLHQFWSGALSDTRIAWDIDRYNNWKNNGKYGLPKNELGEEISESYYLRLAFAHAAWRDMWENPLGYGVTRKAMERIEQKKDPEVSLANAHNGYLNLSCAVGLPGLGLFIAAMAAVFLQLKKSASAWALPAIWMIALYLLHWAVDAIERDHFLEMFMYVIALMLTLALMDNESHEQT